MECYEFGLSSRSRLALWLARRLAGTIMRWPAGWTNGPMRVLDPSDRLLLSAPPEGDCKRKPGNRPAGQGRAARLGSNRNIGAMRCRGVAARRCLVSRLTMSRWQIHCSPAASEAARRFCRDAVASEQFSDAAPGASFHDLPISSIGAPRGAIGRPTRPSQRILARGERVSNGQQNDHRRLTPGRDPGGGPARQSSRGI